MSEREEDESNNDTEHAVDSGGRDTPTAAISVSSAVCCAVLYSADYCVQFCAV